MTSARSSRSHLASNEDLSDPRLALMKSQDKIKKLRMSIKDNDDLSASKKRLAKRDPDS